MVTRELTSEAWEVGTEGAAGLRSQRKDGVLRSLEREESVGSEL